MPIEDVRPGPGRELRALLLSLPALAIPVIAAFVFPESLADYEALLWLLALIPAFLLAYYRGWQGVATSLALGMALISVTYAITRAMGATVPDLLLAVVVAYLAIALGIGWLTEGVSRARLDEARESMALRDPLTDLPNRRQAEAHLDLELGAADRGRPLAVVLFDFDHFAQYNTDHGRAAGDGVLRSFGSLLRQNTRRMNLAARYGPEEFVCILGGCDEAGALTFAARVQERLRAAETTVALPTVSAGVAVYRAGVTRSEQLLGAAEDALRLAKEHGRDRVRVHGRSVRELADNMPDRSLNAAHRALDEARAQVPLAVAADEAADGPPGTGHRVLVIMQDPGARARVVRQLEEEAFAVTEAASWLEVLPRLAAEYSLAFVELATEAANVSEVVRELRLRVPGIRIIGVPRAAGGSVDPALLSIRVDGYYVMSAPMTQMRPHLRELLREGSLERDTQVQSRQLSEEVRAREREARLAAAESEAKYRAVVQSIQQVIFTTDPAGNWTFLNPAWTAITGFNCEESIGRPLWESVHPEDRETLRAEFERLVKTRAGHARHEGRWLTRTGEYRWIEARFQAVTAGREDAEATSGLLTDVTDRRRAEEALRRREEYFRLLIENSGDLVAVLNADQRVRYVSPAVERVLGYSAEEWQELDGRSLVHPEDAERGEALFARALEEPGASCDTVLRVRRRDGEWRLLEVTMRNQLGTPGVEGVVVNARDITERREAEQALRTSQDMLGRAQKMEAIGRLAGGVAHDFNNLLTAIQGHASLLLQDVPDLQPMVRTDLLEIRDAAERATSLTRQLLAFSRRQVLQPRVLDLNLVVADLEKMLRRMIGEHIQLQPALEAPLDLVRADPAQLEQVILNLVMNARDALDRGGRIILRTRNHVVRGIQAGAGELAPGKYVVLEVEDDGEGMAPDIAAQAFEPFFTTKEPGRGTGLGLSTVYGIVHQSGGHVAIASEPGHGTRATVYLPSVAGTLEVAPEPELPQEPAGGSETVLLVEDEKAVRELARRILERKGYRVLTAENGRHALEVQAAYEGDIDLLLSDVVMPEMHGPELADRLAGVRPGMRVLFMSGYAEEAIAHHGLFGSGRDFMEKPFSPDELLQRVRDTLDAGR